MSQPIWLRIDEQRDALRALELFRDQLARALEDPVAWKWALVALHNAAQNVVVASLNRPTLMGTVGPVIAERLAADGRDSNVKTVVPDYFLELYQRVKDDTGLTLPVEVDLAVARLNEHRNAFIHFTPAGWLLHVNELPGIARDALRLIRALGWEPGHVAWQSEDMRQAAAGFAADAHGILDALETRYRV